MSETLASPLQSVSEALEHASDPEAFASGFLQPPLFSLDYASGQGTLYTALYKPAAGVAEYRWPGLAWPQSLHVFGEGSRTVQLLEEFAA